MTHEEAYEVGLRRSEYSRSVKAKHKHGWKPTPEHQRNTDGLSAVAENIASIVTGRRWISPMKQGKDHNDLGDLEGGIEVRWTPVETGALLLHEPEEDPPHLRAVLVTGPTPAMMVVRGWVPVRDGQHKRYWREKGGKVRNACYWIEQNDPIINRDIDTLHIRHDQDEMAWLWGPLLHICIVTQVRFLQIRAREEGWL